MRPGLPPAERIRAHRRPGRVAAASSALAAAVLTALLIVPPAYADDPVGPALTLAAPTASATAGAAVSFTVGGPGDVSAAALTTDDPAAVVSGGSIEFRTAGAHTVTAHLDGYTDAMADVAVAAGPPARIDVAYVDRKSVV